MAAFKDGQQVARLDIKIDPDNSTRWLVGNFYGTDARGWCYLLDRLTEYADGHEIELSAWTAIDSRRVRTFERVGGKPVAYLIRRAPVVKCTVKSTLNPSSE